MNFSTYFAIEKKLHGQGFDFDRMEVIRQFTNGRKSGLRELSSGEYSQFIHWLNKQFSSTTSKPKTDKVQQQRRKIIALLCKMGYVSSGKADMPRIYAWVEKYGWLDKHFNQYTEQELPRLVTQAENFYKSHIERL